MIDEAPVASEVNEDTRVSGEERAVYWSLLYPVGWILLYEVGGRFVPESVAAGLAAFAMMAASWWINRTGTRRFSPAAWLTISLVSAAVVASVSYVLDRLWAAV